MVLHSDISNESLDQIANILGVTIHNFREQGTDRKGRRKTAFVLRPGWNEVYRSFRNGRRVYACSWEAHRVFYLALFNIDPDARIKTGLADYDGLATFNEIHEQTRY